jgi:hypothetical protein
LHFQNGHVGCCYFGSGALGGGTIESRCGRV